MAQASAAPLVPVAESIITSANKLAPSSGALARLLAATSDPDMSFQTLASIVRSDAALAARVMQLANSAYYGMGGHITDAQTAISIIGLVNLRSLALVSATKNRTASPLPGFATVTGFHAAAAARLSRRFDVREADGFSLGLLCDIGTAFLANANPSAFRSCRGEDVDSTLQAERRVFGHDHAAVAAAVLNGWDFPADFCAAIASHHSPVPASTPTGRLLQAASSLYHGRFAELDAVGMSFDMAEMLRADVAADCDNLVAALL